MEITNEMRKAVLLELANGQLPERAQHLDCHHARAYATGILAALMVDEPREAKEQTVLGLLVAMGKNPGNTDTADLAQIAARIRRGVMGLVVVIKDPKVGVGEMEIEIGSSCDPVLEPEAKAFGYFAAIKCVQDMVFPVWAKKAEQFAKEADGGGLH